ncbi:amino acid transporter [Heterobasidion irregulare TC 32-1]|uniref:Amino acid transporter n=1 Tax=Heterobasidion irregulare (strain TC 32-1) TaxID=747525 RepID=W4JRF7_HETIT|nr:amino acid transporter [Heterobasidion irregulare TC 32-1]ETW76157.1 amino acid transporter [Heterobasidion irregulare TC 32-1]
MSLVEEKSPIGPEPHTSEALPGRTRDEDLLASLGYKQELKRSFSPWELFGIAFSFIGLFPSIASVLVYAIPNGGPVAMVWGWAACVPFLTCVALALAELGSAAPTSGGLYYWTHTFSSPSYKNVLSWVVGYSNSVEIVAGGASCGWGLALQIMAAVSIGSDMTFVPTTAQNFGVYAAVLLFQGVICSVAVKYIARLQTVYVILNVVLCLAIIIGLPAATPTELKNTASFAFGDFQNFYNWPNGYAFILSFLAPLWTVGGLEASIHLSEEASNANVAVPWAIIASVTIANVIGWGINVALAFNMGTDMESILNSPVGQPMAAILFNSFGNRGTLAVWAIAVVVQFMVGISVITVGSRQIFAFSRDGALPFSHILRRVNTYTCTPIYSVWFVVIVSLVLGLLAFVGPAAIGTVFSLAIAGQCTAYVIPISARFLGRNEFKRGVFHLGVFSLPVAIVAVLWLVFNLVIIIFPTTPAPTAAEMNYTVAIWGGTIAISLVYYYFPRYGGRSWFRGPVSTLQETAFESGSIVQVDVDKAL